MRAPTAARFPNTYEWSIVCRVFTSATLPSSYRILITDALGGGNRPFTIPTSAISLSTIPAAAQAAFSGLVMAKMGKVGEAASRISNLTGFSGGWSLPSQLLGTVNLGYLVNLGPAAYPNAAINDPNLLVHEFSHVWQGANSASSMTYVNNSIMHQTRADHSTGSHVGAYVYTPGQPWSSYNAEQQAHIIQDWYAAGLPDSGDLWPYIRDYVRRGIT